MQNQAVIVTKRDVETFANNCVATRSQYMHVKMLFESADDNRAILSHAAPVFFGDLNSILNRVIVLNICALTDPEETKRHKNLTVEFFVKHADRIRDPTDKAEVANIRATIRAFRKKLVPARNKLIAHLDREAALGEASLGVASVEDWRSFWSALRHFLQILDRLYIDPAGFFDIEDIEMISDADSLLQRLRLAEKVV